MSADGSTVLFGAHPAQYKLNTAAKRQLARFARTLSVRVASGKSFECLIADDRELRRLNATFLHHDYPTDVLSFPSSDSESLGDIAISIERAAEQAEQYGHTVLDELQILMLHGVLHLAGHDHETDTGEMAASEQRLRLEFGLPHSLIARSIARMGTGSNSRRTKATLTEPRHAADFRACTLSCEPCRPKPSQVKL